MLIDTAQQTASNKNYGLALSLTILGSEEYLKGMVLYFNSVGINVFTIRELRGVLSSHKNRHEMACLIELLRIIEAIIVVDSSKETRKPNKGFLSDLIDFADKASIVLKSFVGIADNIVWWEKANGLKNRGLYVDYDGELKLPSSITKEDYNTANKIITELISSFRVIKIAFERMTSEALSKTIADINEGLKIMAGKNKEAKI